MAGLTNRHTPAGTNARPGSMLRNYAVSATDTVADVAARFGQSALSIAGFSGYQGPLDRPLGLQGQISLSLLAAPIPPFVSMTSPVPPRVPDPYGTGWLGAVSIVQGQYAGQPLSTNM